MLGLCLGALGAEAPTPRMLFSFETDQEVAQVRASNARAVRADRHATEGAHSLLVTADAGANASLILPSGSAPWDIGANGAVAVNAVNDEASPVTLVVQVTDAGGAVTKGKFVLRAKGDTAIALALNSPDPLEVGMRGPAAIPGYRLADSDYKRIDTSKVASIAVSLDGSGKRVRVFLDSVRLAPGISYKGIVDPLGQFALGTWPGKMPGAAGFVEARAAEERNSHGDLRSPDSMSTADGRRGRSSRPPASSARPNKTANGGW